MMGTLMMIGQPAEERGAGTKAMLDDGLFRKFPKPDYALAIHVDSSLRTGDVAFMGGFQQANVDSVDIEVRGRGGHGAYPNTTIDPIVQAAQLVTALQTIVSREVDPIEPAVVTVGSIHGGSKHNIIGDNCKLQLTVRSYSPTVRKQLQDSIKRIANGIATTAGAPQPNIEISEGTPSLLNDPGLAIKLRPVFESALGADHVQVAKPSMGGEDFSRYGIAGVPILMVRLGAVNEQRLKRFKTLGQQPPSLHSPRFYPDARETLSTGVTALASATMRLLKK
jgi:hippurate hydrolase